MSELTASQTIRLEAARILGAGIFAAGSDVRKLLVLAKAIEEGVPSRLEDFPRTTSK